jgi:hypothetical protein
MKPLGRRHSWKRSITVYMKARFEIVDLIHGAQDRAHMRGISALVG